MGEKDEFYHQVQGVISKFSGKDIMIFSGDLNAKVGGDNTGHEEIMGRHGMGVETDNGDRFINLCATNNLVIGGTVFPHKDIHKLTWISPDDRTENQIDHICISRKFRRSLQDVKVVRGADVGSDHHLVVAKLKLKLKKYSQREDSRKKFEVSGLRNKDVRDDFSISLRNRYEALDGLLEDDVYGHWKQVQSIYISM